MALKDDALAAAAEAANATDDGSREAARSLIDAFTRWETTREYGKKERKRCNDNVSAKLAELKEAMEVGHSTEDQQLLKLTVVEGKWQELDEARTERKDVFGAIKDSMRAAEGKIRELIEQLRSPQLGLFTSSTSTIDNPPEPEPEEDDNELPD